MSALPKSEIASPMIADVSNSLPEAIELPKPQFTVSIWVGLIASCLLGLFTLASVQGALGRTNSSLYPTLHRQGVTPWRRAVHLENITVDCHTNHIFISGNLHNQTNRSLKRVEAVVDLLDVHGRTLHTATALLASPTLPQKGEGTFALTLPETAAADSYRVQFRQWHGKLLD